MPAPSIVIFGGTFDPVHLGHLRAAEEIREALRLDEFRLLPCGQPPHREPPRASAVQRLEMLKLALGDSNDFSVDDRELRRRGPSYMVDTLEDFRSEFPLSPLAMVIGQDAANSLDRWHRWHKLPELAHLVIMSRHGDKADYSDEVSQLLATGRVEHAAELSESCSGKVLEVAIDSLPVSASAIRHMIGVGRSPRFLLPDSVLGYIRQHSLY